MKPWIGPYVVKGTLGRVEYAREPGVFGSCRKRASVHTYRLRKIGPGIVESGDPKDGVFFDTLRLLKRIEGCETR